MHVLAASPLSPSTLLSDFGLAGLAVVLFAETGLLIGFFLPGDTLLLAAGIGIATRQVHVPLWQFLVFAPIAAILGNLVGYYLGYRTGPLVFHRPHSRLFRPEYVERSKAFFDRFGWATILIARFVPIVRTIVPVMAGVGHMRRSGFVAATVLGGIVWTDGVLLLGYFLGHVPFVQRNKGYLDYVILAIIALGLLPAGIHYLQGRRRRSQPQRVSE